MVHHRRVDPGHFGDPAGGAPVADGPGPGGVVLLVLLALLVPGFFILGGHLGHGHGAIRGEGSLLTLLDHGYRHIQAEGDRVRLAGAPTPTVRPRS